MNPLLNIHDKVADAVNQIDSIIEELAVAKYKKKAKRQDIRLLRAFRQLVEEGNIFDN